MATNMKRGKRRDLFTELMAGVRAMKADREGSVTLRRAVVEPIAPLPVSDDGRVRKPRRR